MIRQCAVMVGGLGTRLGHLTATTPKPMLPVGGRPFLAWLLRELARFGIEETLLLTGFRSDRIQAALPEIAAHVPTKMRITISEEKIPAGTGGALWNARSLLHEHFLVCNGDSLFAANIAPLLTPATAKNAIGHLLLRHVPDAARYGIVELQGDRVTSFREKEGRNEPAWINAGIYAFDHSIIDLLSERCSLERDALGSLASAGRLQATRGDGYFIDIGIPDDLARSQIDLPQAVLRPSLFLDRNSIVSLHNGSLANLTWVDGALAAIRLATERGWHVFVVSDEGGRSKEQMAAIARRISADVYKAGGTIDDFRWSPHSCIDLIETWEIDPERALIIDNNQAGEAEGARRHLFPGGNLLTFLQPLLDAAG